MKNKKALMGWIALIIVVIVVLGIGAYYYTNNYSVTTIGNSGTQVNAQVNSNTQTNTQTTNTTTAGQTYQVSIQNYAFSTTTLTVHVGDIVVWTNLDSVAHTVTSDSGSELDSAKLSNGQTYSHTFTTAGTFTYHCSIHTMMKATVVVQ